MVVQSLDNLKKSGNNICVWENLEKSGYFTGIFTESKIALYVFMETMLFQIKVPLAHI